MLRDKVQELIGLGLTERALDVLVVYSSDALLLQIRYNKGKKQYNVGLIEFSEWQRIQAQINHAAIKLAASITTKWPK